MSEHDWCHPEFHRCDGGGPGEYHRYLEGHMTRDHTIPEGRWTFDGDVTDVFDDMLERSIPQYDVMRRAVTDLASIYQTNGLAFVDLGASRGEAIADLFRRYGARNQWIAVEVSEPMLAVLRERFGKLVDVRDLDLRTGYPPVPACVTLAVLTLQFVPLEHRQRVLEQAHRWTRPGGALIVVEKVTGATSELDDVFVNRYLRMKAEHGYTAEEIERKRLALEGVLVPLTARENEERLRSAGFRSVDCFWRWLNFAGWIAVA